MIYLDNAATTVPDGESVAAALKFLQPQECFNPSALYRAGFAAHKEIETARKNILSHVADPSEFELTFTSCGSEADNQAVFSGVCRGNFVTTSGEHAAIYNSAKELEKRGFEVRFVPLNADGSVDSQALTDAVDKKTSLVSVIHVNNETGAVNDIASLSAEVKQKNPYTLFHSDGVQAFGKIPFRLPKTVDFYTISAHKIGGMRGVAGLIHKKGVRLNPYIFGGGQEGGLRSGTENTFAIKQFEFAAEKKYKTLQEDYNRLRGYGNLVRDGLDRNRFEILSSKEATPYIVSVTAKGVRGEVLMHMLDDDGLIVGTGSACSSKTRYSRVMLACGLDDARADGVLRLSFCPSTTEEEVKQAIELLNRDANALAKRMK